MQFLYPIGLLALAGLIIPLLIHLWNVKQGKTLKIGSIALLGESSQLSAKSFRINDWLLLVLRCLLLILLAFLLAQPFLKKTNDSKNSGHWILVDETKLAQAYQAHQSTIDSLLKQGYTIHDFNVDFKLLSLADTSSAKHTMLNANSISYTSLLHQLNEIIPGASVYLFADHHLIHFGNEIPAINYQLYWKILQSDTLSHWTTNYAGKQYEAKSTPSATSYQALNVGDTVIRIAINEPSGTDRNYLIAALNAIASFTKRKIVINPASGKIDLGFWLTTQPVSANFKAAMKENGSILQYEKGKINTTPSFVNVDGKQIKLSKRIATNNQQGKIWADGFGNPVLSSINEGKLNILHFYSRFNPQWNELVWNDTFVKALMPFVINATPINFGFEDHLSDQRVLATKQKETISNKVLSKKAQSTTNQPIMIYFWISALLLFMVERILSFNKTKHAN